MTGLIPFAYDEHGKLIHVSQAKSNGLGCDCTCPSCGCRLVAKRDGRQKRPHFAHYQNVECDGARETVLHLLAKEIIAEEKRLMMPPFRCIQNAWQELFTDIRIEERRHRSDLQPDAEGTTIGGEVVLIEFRVTHAVDDAKLAKIREVGLACVEIDLNGVEMDKEAMRRFLTEDESHREWLNSPRLELLWQARQQRRKEALRRKEERKAVEAERERKERLSRQQKEIERYREKHPEIRFLDRIRCRKCPYHSGLNDWWCKMEGIRPIMPEWGMFYLTKTPQQILEEGFVISAKPAYVLDETGRRRYIYPKELTDSQKRISDRLYQFFNSLHGDAVNIIYGQCNFVKKKIIYDGKDYIACANQKAWP